MIESKAAGTDQVRCDGRHAEHHTISWQRHDHALRARDTASGVLEASRFERLQQGRKVEQLGGSGPVKNRERLPGGNASDLGMQRHASSDLGMLKISGKDLPLRTAAKHAASFCKCA